MTFHTKTRLAAYNKGSCGRLTRFVRKVIVRLLQKPVFPAVVCRIWVTTGRSYAMESCRGRKNGQFTEFAAATGSNGPLQSCRGRDSVCYFAALGPLRYILPQPSNHRSVRCAAFCLSRVTIARSTAFCPGRITIVIPPNSDMAYGPLLGPLQSNMAPKPQLTY